GGPEQLDGSRLPGRDVPRRRGLAERLAASGEDGRAGCGVGGRKLPHGAPLVSAQGVRTGPRLRRACQTVAARPRGTTQPARSNLSWAERARAGDPRI